MRAWKLMMVSAAWALVLVGCGGGGAEEPEAGGAEGGETSEYGGPIASTDVDHGKEVYGTHCDDCHPDGQEDVGPSLIAEPHSPADLRKQVREGSGKMRPFSPNRLSDDDLEAMLAYLDSIGAVAK
ncbi:MAG: cytochrome c [Myxococcales bacterium]|nr:cytochrome c [Myxococcales bacterium]